MHDLTFNEAEFPWKAWLSGLPAVAEMVAQNFEEIKLFAVVYLWAPPQRTAFYVVHVDGTEWILEPGNKPIKAQGDDIDRTGW